MAENYNEAKAPKDFWDAAKKVAVNSFVAVILAIIVYSSILLLYRSFIAPGFAGYNVITQTYNKQGELIKEEVTDSIYFEDLQNEGIPKDDEIHRYSPIYGVEPVSSVISQILCMTVLFIMIYSICWSYGAHQKNAVQFGKMDRDRFEGAKVGLASSVVGIFAFLVIVLAKFGIDTNISFKLFALVNGTYLPLINGLVEGAQGGLTVISKSVSNISWTGILIMLIPLVLKILVCQIGYDLGYKGISIREKLIYKNKD